MSKGVVSCECYIHFVRCFPVSQFLNLDVIMWIVGFDPLFFGGYRIVFRKKFSTFVVVSASSALFVG